MRSKKSKAKKSKPTKKAPRRRSFSIPTADQARIKRNIRESAEDVLEKTAGTLRQYKKEKKGWALSEVRDNIYDMYIAMIVEDALPRFGIENDIDGEDPKMEAAYDKYSDYFQDYYYKLFSKYVAKL